MSGRDYTTFKHLCYSLIVAGLGMCYVAHAAEHCHRYIPGTPLERIFDAVVTYPLSTRLYCSAATDGLSELREVLAIAEWSMIAVTAWKRKYLILAFTLAVMLAYAIGMTVAGF
ncbi:putative transmembrane protein [Gregarina niphandrodes]|uniref:Transmembrane protein n=1 Tax=Gregarina niphandrodes TaxID=110365 RepID=A0A023B521_GRENI|nr:putative transmembrane protein [Gregarina niphandrodes]EZG58296.1 putative transmembrane protein [Gregarina niphandrodes]|eukprot:XP_011130983.1 putative transmembrane protein [Gregarina niphandrodes]